MPDPQSPTYTPPPAFVDPTTADAQASTDYTTGVGQIDQQAGLNEQTYAQNRAETIRSYQNTLDSLSYGLQQAGLQARGAYSRRNLYNAGGDLSGTGQLVGTELTQPITRQITSAQQTHEGNLARLGTAEAQGRLNIATAKTDLLKSVLANLTATAKNKYNEGVSAAKTAYDVNKDSYDVAMKAKEDEAKATLEASKLPGGAIDTLKVTQGEQAKGRTLLYQKDLANAVKMYGKDAVIKIGNQKFLLSAQEREALKNVKLSQQTKIKALNKTSARKKETAAQTKSSILEDIKGASGIVSTSGEELVTGSGKKSREAIAAKIHEAYRDDGYSLDDIKKMVYGYFPG